MTESNNITTQYLTTDGATTWPSTTSATTHQTESDNGDEDDDGGSTVAAVGGAVAAVVLVAVVAVVVIVVLKRRSAHQKASVEREPNGSEPLHSLLSNPARPGQDGQSATSSGTSPMKARVTKFLARLRHKEDLNTSNSSENVPVVVIHDYMNVSVNREENKKLPIGCPDNSPMSLRHPLDTPEPQSDYLDTYTNLEPTAIHVGDAYIVFVTPGSDFEEETCEYDYAYLCESDAGVDMYISGDGSIYEDPDGLLRKYTVRRKRKVSSTDVQDYIVPESVVARSKSEPDIMSLPIPAPRTAMTRTPDVNRKQKQEPPKKPLKVPRKFLKPETVEGIDTRLPTSNDNVMEEGQDSGKPIENKCALKVDLDMASIQEIKSKLKLIATRADKELHDRLVTKSDNIHTKDYEFLPKKRAVPGGRVVEHKSGVKTLARQFENKGRPS